MNRKTLFFTLTAFVLISGCNAQGKKDAQNKMNGFSGGMSITESGYVPADGARSFLKSEYEKTPDTKTTVTINLTKETITSSDESAVSVSYKAGLYTIKGADGAGNFLVSVSGKSDNAALSIDSDKKSDIVINLNGATLTSNNTPCISVASKSDVYLVAEGENSLTDGRQYGTLYGKKSELGGAKDKGSVYVKGALVLNGNGSINLTENYKHGFYASDFIYVINGTYTVNSTGRNGFQCVNAFVMDGGTVNVNGTGNNINNQSRGIVVEGSEDNPGEGFVEIRDGTVNINTVSKGITAKWDIDEDPETTETTDDPYPYVKISGGVINITTTGMPQDESAQEYTFTDADGETVSEKTKLSPEGIEGKQDVFITGGIINLNTTDDAINASCDHQDTASSIVISGGEINIVSSRNDGIDSNGIITVTGGKITAVAVNMPECAFDCDQNAFGITGGTIVSFGTSNYTSPTASACKNQGTFVLNGSDFTAGGKIVVKKGSKEVFSCDIPSSIRSTAGLVFIISSPDFKTGVNYTVTNGSKDVETKVKFTEDSLVYTSSNVQSGFGGGFGRGGFGGGFGGGRMNDENFDPANMPEGFDPDNMPEPPEGFDPNNRPDGQNGFDPNNMTTPPEGFNRGGKADRKEGNSQR